MTDCRIPKKLFQLGKECGHTWIFCHDYHGTGSTFGAERRLYNCCPAVCKPAGNPEMNRMWHLMEDYGKEQAALSPDADEIPVMSITVVPMLLGGQYGMVAHDPIFYHIQPSRCNGFHGIL